MYRIICLIGFFIRQFLLPNPFEHLGDISTIVNLIVGGVLIPLSYYITGLLYERGSDPVWGTILFNIVYIIKTGIIQCVCFVYPRIWLMIIIGVMCFLVEVSLLIRLKDMY